MPLDPVNTEPLFTTRNLKLAGVVAALVALALNSIGSGGVLTPGGTAAKWVAIALGFVSSAQAVLHLFQGTEKPAP